MFDFRYFFLLTENLNMESVEDIFNTFADPKQMKIFKISQKNDNSLNKSPILTDIVACPFCDKKYEPLRLKKHILSKFLLPTN